MEYYSALKKKNILTHATIRMKLKDMLTEISQKGKDKYDGSYMTHLCVCLVTQSCLTLCDSLD